jgi:hypothetical protein
LERSTGNNIDTHETKKHTIDSIALMADKDPPSPEREDDTLPFRRWRVKPSMRAKDV